MIMYDIHVPMGSNFIGSGPKIKCHDTGIDLRIFPEIITKISRLRETRAAYAIPEGATAVVKIAKPDKTYGVQDGTVQGDSIIFELNPQALTVAGTALAEVNIFSADGRRITTGTFTLDVVKECADDCSPDSKSYVDILAEYIMDTKAAAAEVQTAVDDAEHAKKGAETAQKAAENAAKTAVNSAESASVEANKAKSAAQSASKELDAATAAAERAEEAATEAQTAVDDAEHAKEGAGTAQKAAENAAKTAVNSAESASDEAEKAKSAAESAITAAEKAEEIAKSVKADADAGNSLKLENNESERVSFKEEDEKLLAVVRETSTISLDTVAYENKTYRDIFVTANMFTIGDFENGFGDTTSSKVTPEITDEAHISGTHSMKCFGSAHYRTATTQRQGFPQSTVYCAASVRVDRYVQGNVGIQAVCGDLKNIVLTRTTDGFERLSGTRSVGAGANLTAHVGTYSSPDVDAYIDDVVIIDLSMFTVAPSKEKLDDLYDNYINILLGNTVLYSEKSYIISNEEPQETEYGEVECVAAFMEKVNEKAAELGMTNSLFTYPSGVNSGETTARDLMRLFVASTSYDELMRVWAYDTKTITVKGENARTESVSRSDGSSLTNYYYMFGRKTGAWQTADGLVNNLGVIAEVSGKMVAGAVMKAVSYDGRFSAMKQMFDIAKQVIENPDTDISSLSVADAECCCCCIVPSHYVNCYERYPFDCLFEQDADTVAIPASVTKVITAMVMLDYIKELDETIEIVKYDITGGSGAIFNEGDIISYRDTLIAMMLPSSNTAAQAVARCVGKKILAFR